ncbi:hypothetical protein HDV00_002272 [Rhizophlyctis rosea]|nr:hypothetical protein HDV00_002272 [Rhizophlyctis rosea]
MSRRRERPGVSNPEEDDVLYILFNPASSRATKRNAATDAYRNAAEEVLLDSILKHLDEAEKDEELQWWFGHWIQLFGKVMDRVKEAPPTTAFKLLQHLTNCFTKHGFNLIPSTLATYHFTGTCSQICFHLATVDPNADATLKPTLTSILRTWQPHLESIDLQGPFTALIRKDFCEDDALADKIKEIQYNRAASESRTQIDPTNVDPFAQLLDLSIPPGIRLSHLDAALKLLNDSSTPSKTFYTLLDQARGSYIPIIATLPQAGWVADELLRILQICYEDIKKESEKGGIATQTDWDGLADVFEAVAQWEDDGVLKGVYALGAVGHAQFQFLKEKVGRERFRELMAKWMDRYNSIDSNIAYFLVLSIADDQPLVNRYGPVLLSTYLKTGNPTPLGAIIYSLKTAVMANPKPYIAIFDDLLTTMTNDWQKMTWIGPVFEGLRECRPDILPAHVDKIMALLSSCDEVVEIGNLMVAVEMLKIIGRVDPLTLATDANIDELGRMLEVVATGGVSILNPLFEVVGSTSTDAAIKVADHLLNYVEKHHVAASSDPYSQHCLQTITRLSLSSPKIQQALAKAYVPRLEVLTSDTSRASPAVKETTHQVLDELKGITLRSVQEQIGKVGAVWKQLGFDVEDPLLNAIENVSVDTMRKYDVMLSYNWGTQAIVKRIHDSLVSRGYTVWFDLNLMSGNVYAKMAEAVLGSSVIVPCLTAAYENSPNCKRELGFAADQARQGKKIVPVRLEQGPFTWSALITAGLLYTQIGEREVHDEDYWEMAMGNLCGEIEKALEGVERQVDGGEGGVKEEVDGRDAMQKVVDRWQSFVRSAPEITTGQIPPQAVTNIFARLDKLEGKFSLGSLLGSGAGTPTGSEPGTPLGAGTTGGTATPATETAPSTPKEGPKQKRPMSMSFFFSSPTSPSENPSTTTTTTASPTQSQSPQATSPFTLPSLQSLPFLSRTQSSKDVTISVVPTPLPSVPVSTEPTITPSEYTTLLTRLDSLETRFQVLEDKMEERVNAVWDFVARQAEVVTRAEKRVKELEEGGLAGKNKRYSYRF